MGQVATEEKSNEITAIPAVLELVDVKGAIVTIDAMGCQKAIAEKIIERGGDYVLPVKGNQGRLEQAVETYFDEHLENDFAGIEVSRFETEEKHQAASNVAPICKSTCRTRSPAARNGPDFARWESPSGLVKPGAKKRAKCSVTSAA